MRTWSALVLVLASCATPTQPGDVLSRPPQIDPRAADAPQLWVPPGSNVPTESPRKIYVPADLARYGRHPRVVVDE